MAGIAPQPSNELNVLQTDIRTYFIDGAVGSAFGNGVHRILCGQYIVNPDPAAVMPGVQHVVNIAIPTSAIPALIKFLQEMPGLGDDEE